MKSNHIANACIAAKLFCGLVAIAIGVVDSNPNTIIFGAGHAFIGAPLWYYFR